MFRGQEWRRHPLLTGCSNKPLPMLGTAIVAFSIYVAFETGFKIGTGWYLALVTIRRDKFRKAQATINRLLDF